MTACLILLDSTDKQCVFPVRNIASCQGQRVAQASLASRGNIGYPLTSYYDKQLERSPPAFGYCARCLVSGRIRILAWPLGSGEWGGGKDPRQGCSCGGRRRCCCLTHSIIGYYQFVSRAAQPFFTFTPHSRCRRGKRDTTQPLFFTIAVPYGRWSSPPEFPNNNFDSCNYNRDILGGSHPQPRYPERFLANTGFGAILAGLTPRHVMSERQVSLTRKGRRCRVP